MRLKYLIYLFILWVPAIDVYGEDPKCHRSTEGKEFWFGFMEGRNINNNVHYLEITVTARKTTNFKIYIGKSTTPLSVANSVNANGSVQIRISLAEAEATGSESIQEKGIHLVADDPVNLYALNWDRNSADVAVIYPLESLGNEYFTMCYEPNVHNNVNHGRNSEFLVVASEDSTVVEITPSVITDKGKPAKIPFTVKLNKGEVYQVQSLNRSNLTGQGDLTGSYIKSNKPVAVFSGNYSTTVPVESGMGGYDHLFEQMSPLQAWGREYYAVPLYTRLADRYRLMASEDNTAIRIGNNPQVFLDRGEYFEFTLPNSSPSRIIASNPVIVAQFSQSNNTDRNYTGGNGDPFMIMLSPVSQAKNNVTFVAYNSNQIRDYYVNIVALSSEIYNIELDGALVGHTFKPFTGTGYSYAQLRISSGTHTLKNLNPDRGFLAYVYGYGGNESYGYGVGFNLDLVLDLGQTIDFEGDTLPICHGQSVVLDAGPYFDNYLWNTGDTTQKITVTKEGLYRATGSTTDGCLKSDTLYVLVSNPEKPNIGIDKQGCYPYSVKTNAGSGYTRYEWSTGETSQIIEPDKNGQYSVRVFDKYGCYKSDTMNLTVFAVPEISMDGEQLVCGLKTRNLKLNFKGADQNMLANGKMEWGTDKPGKLTFNNKSNTSTDISVTGWGDYKVMCKFTTPDGCTSESSFSLRFAQIPTSKIEFADEGPNDKCKGYSREIIYKGNASRDAAYYWNYNGCLADSVDWNLRRISLGVFNSNPFVSLFVEENGCWSADTAKLAIGANPDFVMNTVKSRGCDSATIYFSGELKVRDSLRFEWDFGDNSTVSNLQKPRHFYADTGKFNVNLNITNVLNGCKVGFTIPEMVKIFPTPAAKIEFDPDLCHDKTLNAIYSLNIDSSYCSWSFDGAHKTGEGNDTITVYLDKQVATIRLQVDEYGCKSSWVEKTAKRKPIFDFKPGLTEGCQPLQVLLKASTSDESILFKWITDSLLTNGDNHIFTLPGDRNYNFTLAAESLLTGCPDTIIKNNLVLVHPKPKALFDVDYPVAIIEHADLQFTNLTQNVEGFHWDFDDNSPVSILENPKHTFTDLGKYHVELIVETEFGCLDTATLQIEILPFTVFTPNAFRPESEIPENREFMPVGVGIDPERFEFKVFNRWGELVFESRNPGYKWDGTTKNSNPAPMGNYIWKADFDDIQGFHHSMNGQVLLIR